MRSPTVANFKDFVDRLDPSRTRDRYRDLVEAGEIWTVSLPFHHSPLWLVESEGQARELVERRGIPRWQVWTLNEAQDLLRVCGNEVVTMSEALAALASSAPPEGKARKKSQTA